MYSEWAIQKMNKLSSKHKPKCSFIDEQFNKSFRMLSCGKLRNNSLPRLPFMNKVAILIQCCLSACNPKGQQVRSSKFSIILSFKRWRLNFYKICDKFVLKFNSWNLPIPEIRKGQKRLKKVVLQKKLPPFLSGKWTTAAASNFLPSQAYRPTL